MYSSKVHLPIYVERLECYYYRLIVLALAYEDLIVSSPYAHY